MKHCNVCVYNVGNKRQGSWNRLRKINFSAGVPYSTLILEGNHRAQMISVLTPFEEKIPESDQ